MLYRNLCLIFVLAFGIAGLGCDKSSAPTEEPAAESPADPAEAQSETGLVEVPAEGKKFDPPIKPERIPDGVWYCDMGTVEYARAEKGDGKCPVCGMFLKQKGASAEGKAADGHEGHDHEGHGHEGHDHDEEGHEGHDHEGHDH